MSHSSRTQGRDSRVTTSVFKPLLIAIVLFCQPAASALQPDQILLVTNKNEKQGLRLAQYYAQKRGLPDHRILELDLPTDEEMPPELYDRDVVPVVRTYLRDHHLDRQITCIVTFYGVPIRVSARVNSRRDIEELESLKAEQAALPGKIEPMVRALEQMVKASDASFSPKAGNGLEELAVRADWALRSLGEVFRGASPMARARLTAAGKEVIEPIMGPMGLLQRNLVEQALVARAQAASQPSSRPATVPASGPANKDIETFVRFQATLGQLQDHKFDPAARRELRELIQKYLGPFEYAKVLNSQITYFQTEATTAAFDSELSLLWWEYPRYRWLGNPLNAQQTAARTPPVIMTMRLDGPTPQTVTRIIDDSLKAEAEGLTGGVVIDSRGLPVRDGAGKPNLYGVYDQSLRDLAALLRAKTKLTVVFDDRPEVIPAHTVKDVAVYMGWYSLNEYVPACSFKPGAVGFHLASFTMASLRRNNGGGWVRALLNDGIAATLGPVDEPYLQSFPTADEFFPLLLTGKLTLAEVYWKTTPMTSWMISMIGDPLYTPYKVNPAIAVKDLPPKLRKVFEKPIER